MAGDRPTERTDDVYIVQASRSGVGYVDTVHEATTLADAMDAAARLVADDACWIGRNNRHTRIAYDTGRGWGRTRVFIATPTTKAQEAAQ